jgi:hypothetical protein
MSEPVSQYDHIDQQLGTLTADGKLHEENDTDFEGHNVENKMTKVVRSNAVVNPRAVTSR